MKAVVYHKKNVPDKLVYGEVPWPVPGDHEVLIRVLAVSVNAADYRSMRMGIIPKSKIFGADVAGRVEAIGKNIRLFKPGDEVMGDLAGCGFGGFAEYAVAPEKMLVRKPAEIAFDHAAALPMAGVTALQALRDKGKIQKGHRVLIAGSGGGVGTFAVQLAKHFGAVVTAVCGPHNVAQMQSLGASRVIDYTKEDFTQDSERYNILLAVNGNYPLLACRKCLVSAGRYVMVGGALPQIFKSILFGQLLSFGSRKILFLAARPSRDDLAFIAGLAVNGCVGPIIDRTYPLEKTAEAMRYVGAGHAQGKVVIRVAGA